MFISVVGAIGVGKSTLIDALGDKIIKCYERVDQKLLELFYSDPISYAFLFQISVFDNHVDMVRDGIKNNLNNLPMIFERSMHCQNLFWELQPKNTSADMVYQKMWQKWNIMIPKPTLYIFLDTEDVDSLLERIKNRARGGEENISIEYEKRLIETHRRFYTKERFGDQIIILDAMDSVEANVNKINQIINQYDGACDTIYFYYAIYVFII